VPGLSMQSIKERSRAGLDPLVAFLVHAGVAPAGLTIAGLVASLAAGVGFAAGRFGLGALLLLLAGLCDVLDGGVARAAGTSSTAGAYLDSTVDRYSELVVYLGLAVHYRTSWTALAVLLATAGAAQVSYARARAEGLGEDCRVGFFQRPERTTALLAGGVLGPHAMRWVLWGLAVVTNLTAIHRMNHVHRHLRGNTSHARIQTPSGARERMAVQGTTEGEV
jgi:CDP-diacylglycerol--glycerol-3-phosphate 3-phosphatidyltransferase